MLLDCEEFRLRLRFREAEEPEEDDGLWGQEPADETERDEDTEEVDGCLQRRFLDRREVEHAVAEFVPI